ncbi:Wadjet anti-phage system protein JetD domain-containing protein [Glaciibacter superstes]|uniref:Wadjet anti-phage system protein JetD domain-containing protein n=1 Tax=Glaciibacter superstes TaxID=501023 RepID=UPI0003B6A88C|nr:DUF3322 and DUF2220 domain-containing protein [Glaciibacter superstes]
MVAARAMAGRAMAGRSMVTVVEARERARKQVEQKQREWAAVGVAGGDDAVLEIVLHPPTERSALADQAGAIGWVRSWRAVSDATDSGAAVGTGVTVHWGDRHWPSIGAQSVPERCVLRGADAIAAFAGAAPAREWRTLRERAVRLRAAFASASVAPVPADPVPADLVPADPVSADLVPVDPSTPVPPDTLAAAIRTHARTLQRLAEKDFATLLEVVRWLAEHPASGWRIRQLPIRGIDTKWLEGHRSVVEALHSAVSGRESLGLIEAPNLVRVRFLDPALRPGGLCDVIAPVDELAALHVTPRTVFVFENLETVLAMPELPGAVVVHGGGYAARRLRGIPWIQTGHIVYWGDLDSDGFAILHVLRTGCADVTSVLMDEGTLLGYRDLWVPEPKAAVGTYPTLAASEQQTLERIRAEGNVRLEQERIPWAVALERLVAFTT